MPIQRGPSARTATSSTRPRKTTTPKRAVARAPRPTKEQRETARAANREQSALSVEQVLISSILNQSDMHVAVSMGVEPDMFVGFKDEYAYLSRVYTKHKKTPTIIAFRNRFPDFRIVTTADDTGHLSEELRRIYVQSEMVDSMRDALEQLRNGDIEEATSFISNALRSASSSIVVNERDIDLLTDYDEMYAEVSAIKERADETGRAGIPLGFPVYDDRTGGAKPGEFIVVAARLGQGKSAILAKWATTALKHDAVVQFDSLEMSRTQVGMRVHSLLSADYWPTAFNSEDLMLGRNVDLAEYRRFLDSLKKKIKGRFIVSDNKRGRKTVHVIEREIERNQPDIVFVDYIQLVGRRSNDWQGLGEVSGDLAVLAQEAGIPIVVASQLNRANGLGKENAGPEAISGADAIGHDAHQIISIRQNSPSTLTIQSVKNRHGRSGMKWYVDYRPGDGVIRECSFEQWEKLKDADLQKQDDEMEDV